MLKENKGVTLVALVITIIVLLILAGVTLSMVMGESGIFGKANNANVATRLADAKDAVNLAVMEATAAQYSDKDGSTVSDKLFTGTAADDIALVNSQLNGYFIDASGKVFKGSDATGTAIKDAKDAQLTVTITVDTTKHSARTSFTGDATENK